jgi:hypothetical protein
MRLIARCRQIFGCDSHRQSGGRRKSIAITLELCSRSVGIRVHDGLETANTMRWNMR